MEALFIKPGKKRKLLVALAVLVVLGVLGGIFAWYKFFREVPQDPFDSPHERFKYGSLGGENEAGIPYWIFIVLPRLFPEYLPGLGGYASLGVAWEQGKELPIGFTRKIVGFPRVSNNCAVCHTAAYRGNETENPTFVPAGPGHTMDVQGYFRFLTRCAKDPRFNGPNLMREIELVYDLSWIDALLYRFVIIPVVKKRLVEQEQLFAWMEHPELPAWSRGRDDPMNLTKYFMLRMPEDGTFGPADMPSIWNLNKYTQGMTMNWDGASYDPRTVLTDSALGIVVEPQDDFEEHMQWLEDYLRNLPPPKYPFPVDEKLAAVGKPVFERNCAACHASERTGKPVPVEEVGTDRNRLESWNKEAAIAANKTVNRLGVKRTGMVEETLTGYIAVHLDGVWLRAPYLHNGSVPTLRAMLTPPEQRPKVFYRGYDLYDKAGVGFVAHGAEAERVGVRFDTTQRANGNQGHDYGTALSAGEKNALIEFLKTM